MISIHFYWNPILDKGDMTYNFDPDKWYENEFAILKGRADAEEISQEEFDAAAQDLENKHEEMWRRLNGSYRVIPEK